MPMKQHGSMLDLALDMPELSPRDVAITYTDEQSYFISESTVYRLLKAHDLITSPAYILMMASDKFQQPTVRVNEMWQTDFTYLKVTGWGWYFLLTILDDFSRYIIAWKLYTTMEASDVKDLLEQAISETGATGVRVHHRPRLLSDNGPCFVAKERQEYLEEHGMKHTRGRPYHPQTQGKIERYHRTMKNVVKLEHYYYPWELEAALRNFVAYYNNERYHESLDNVTPADVYFGRQYEIVTERDRIKKRTMRKRKKEYLAARAA